MQIMLETWGYHVICAYDGVETLTLMRQTPSDLILSDVHTPDQDGLP